MPGILNFHYNNPSVTALPGQLPLHREALRPCMTDFFNRLECTFTWCGYFFRYSAYCL